MHNRTVDPGTTSAKDQRQKDECPQDEAGQTGQEEHILAVMGIISESSFDYPPTN